MATQRDSVFIGHAQSERQHVEDIDLLLAAEGIASLSFWSTKGDRPNPKWRNAANDRLDLARVCVLLLSAEFLTSPLVENNELLSLLADAERDGAPVLVIYAESIDLPPSSALARFEALNSPDTATNDMTPQTRRALWQRVVQRILSLMGRDPQSLEKLELVPSAPQLLDDPLQARKALIDEVIERYRQAGNGDSSSSGGQTNRAVRAAADSLGATVAMVIEDVHTERHLIVTSSPSDSELESHAFAAACRLIRSSLARSSSLKWARRGVQCTLGGTDGARRHRLLVVPLTSDVVRYLVMVWPLADAPLLPSSIAVVLQAVYRSAERISGLTPNRLHAEILDTLKSEYGHLPDELYDQRRRLFSSRLRELLVHFQPIVFIAPANPYIHGWEALARDETTQAVPSDVLNAAELWGHRLLGELDEHMLVLAAETMAEQNATSGRGPGEMESLAINVYPSSLYRRTYFDTIREVIDYRGTLPGPKLVLEISEKQDLPIASGELSLEDKWVRFRREISRYVDRFHLEFAIDDFGAGYASSQRLAMLSPQYVKLDQAIVNRDDPKHEIDYVNARLHNPLRAPRVVAEGVENPELIVGLWQLGIRYMQGWSVARSGPDIIDLRASTDERLVSIAEQISSASTGLRAASESSTAGDEG